MSELLNAFNNAWPFVQIFMLATLLGLCALPVWLAQRWLAMRQKLPDDVLVALRQNGDLVTLSVRQGAPISPNQLTRLLNDPVTQAHKGPPQQPTSSLP